eukprot:symbB.v1.2.032742.t1/scaffold3969.1/size47216/2
MLWLTVLAKHGNPDLEATIEQPQDPEEWQPAHKPRPECGYPTFLRWPETFQAKEQAELRQVRMDQGRMGHPRRKPTTLLSSSPEIHELDGLRLQGVSSSWSPDLQHRLEEAKVAAEWAPGLCDVLMLAINRKASQHRWRTKPGAQRRGALPPMARGPARAAMLGAGGLRSEEKATTAMWAAHYHAGHVPFRRDCAVCLEAAGRDRPRKAVASPSAYTWSLDLMGPFVESHDQEIPFARYGLVSVVTIPTFEDLPVVKGLQELGAKKPSERNRPLPRWEEAAEDTAANPGEWEQGDRDDDLRAEELTQAEITKVQRLAQEWKSFIKEAKDVGEMRTLTFVQPVKSRSAKDVLQGISRVFARIQALQIPILRTHMDREKAFVSKEVTGWMAQKGLYCTYTAGDEPCGNARAEREIGVLRGRCRALMRSTNLDPSLWALAFRHAGEERLRTQLWQLGVVTPVLLPFGAKAMVKKKVWFQRADPWKWPMTPVTILGPAGDMSMTSGGYYCRDESGRFFRSTVVVVPRRQATTAQALDEELQQLQQEHHPAAEGSLAEEDVQPDPIAPRPDAALWGAEDIFEAYRLHGELPMPRRGTKQSVPELEQVSQSAHALEQVSQSVHELEQVSQSVHELQQSSQSVQAVEPGTMVLEERHEQDVLVVMDPPTRRVTGKSTPGQLLTPSSDGPSLRELRKGGEWDLEAYAMDSDGDKFELWQHQRVKHMIQDEMAEMMEGKSTDERAKALIRESRAMEKVMDTKAKMRALATPEVLQTRTVPLEEVKRHLEEWRPAFEKEYNTLTAGPVEVLSREQSEELRRSGAEVEILPMKAVTVRKPDKYKARFVVCGNMATETADEETNSVGGVCTIAVRSLVHKAVLEGWKLGTIDVAAAFLQAPRRGEKVALVEPPSILRQFGLTSPGEHWKVRCALYGYAESPADWSAFRDRSLASMSWEVENEILKVLPTEEPHLWQVIQQPKTGAGDQRKVRGYLAVYVDDLLIGGDIGMLGSFFAELKRMWRCSEEEMVGSEKWTRFCGYELREDGEGGVLLSQANYVRDLVNRRGIEEGEEVPIGKLQDDEDEEPCNQSLKDCQTLIGEVQWIAGRTRPDISYSIGVLSRLMHRRPRYVKAMMMGLLKYLRTTVERCLHYRKPAADQDCSTLVVATDASFGPEHEQFRSVSGVVISHAGHVIHWLSGRQPFITQSTCEAELMAFSEGYQAGESTAALMSVMDLELWRELVGDNRAALAQVTGDTGPWRTRHLRIRAAKVREAIRSETSPWSAKHQDGTLLVADGCTKSLQGQAFRAFIERLSMTDFKEKKIDGGGASGVRRLEAELCPGQELLHDGSVALLGGGLALLCGSQRKHLGLLLMLCGGLLQGWKYQDRKTSDNDRTRDHRKSKEERSSSVTSGSGAAISNEEWVTGKPQVKVGKLERRGKEEMIKTQEKTSESKRDPSGKGTTHPQRENPLGMGTPRNSPQSDCKEERVALGVEGRKPGIRAIRMNRWGDGRSDGNGVERDGAAASTGGAAAASTGGAAAASTGGAAASSTGGAAASSTGGAAASSTSEATATSRSALVRGRAGMVQMDATVDRTVLSSTVDGRMARLEVSQGHQDRGYGHETRGMEASGGATYFVDLDVKVTVHEKIDAEAKQTPKPPKKATVEKEGRTYGERPEVEPSHGIPPLQPWKTPKYQTPPNRASDAWDMSYVREGWLVREHGKQRKRLFHPVHGSTPVGPTELEERRCTVRFMDSGLRDERMDDWRGVSRTNDNEKWRGYTFIQVKAGQHHFGRKVGPMMDHGTDLHEDSDGSYEKISE